MTTLPADSARRNISAMKKSWFALLPVLCALIVLAADDSRVPPMPAAVSGNAVASLKGGLQLFSMMGVGPRKTWDDVTNQVYIMNLSSGKWSDGRPVTGVAGRLGASAVGARGQVYLFGGYVIDGQGSEITVSDVNAYVPQEQRWFRAADIPTPVARAVIGVNHDRYIYLVGGRSKTGPVNRSAGVRSGEEFLEPGNALSRYSCFWSRRRVGGRHHRIRGWCHEKSGSRSALRLLR